MKINFQKKINSFLTPRGRFHIKQSLIPTKSGFTKGNENKSSADDTDNYRDKKKSAVISPENYRDGNYFQMKLNQKLFFVFITYALLSNSPIFAQTYKWAFDVGSTSNEAGKSIKTDSISNMYVTGDFRDVADFDPGAGTANLTPSNIDIFVASYDSSGNYRWAFKIGGTGYDWGKSLTLDSKANVYVTGYFNGTDIDFDPGTGTANLTSSSDDAFIASYTSAGNFRWAFNLGDYGDFITIDDSANVYVTGRFWSTVDFNPGAGTANLTASSTDVFLAKYDSTGTYKWAIDIVKGANNALAYSVAVDSLRNSYVTGYFSGTEDFDPSTGTANLTSTGSYDIFVAKYNANGNYIWANSFGSAYTDIGRSIITDTKYVYVYGEYKDNVDFDPGTSTANLSTSASSAVNPFIAKYDSAGNYIRAFKIEMTEDAGTGGPGVGYPETITFDGLGNFYVIGTFWGKADFNPSTADTIVTSSYKDIYISKYDTSGNYLRHISLGANDHDFIYSLSVSPTKVVYVTGTMYSWTIDMDPGTATVNLNRVGGTSDLYVAKYGEFLSITLPIELLSFSAKPINNKYVLTEWTTTTEINNDYFTVEKTKDARQYEFVGRVKGAGNSNTTLSYQLIDTHPYQCTSYYRLKQTDYDGKFTYSQIVPVNLNEVDIISISPNPAKDYFEYKIGSTEKMSIQIKVVDILGQIVINKTETIEKGITSKSINISGLSSGTYILQIITENKEVRGKQFQIK